VWLPLPPLLHGCGVNLVSQLLATSSCIGPSCARVAFSRISFLFSSHAVEVGSVSRRFNDDVPYVLLYTVL